MQRALVTGAAGFIGSHLAAGLLGQGWHVTGLDSRYPPSDPVAAENLADLTPHPRFRLARADIATADLARLLEGVQVAFHLAGLPGARRSWGDQFPSYLTVNVLGTQRLLEACAAAEVPRLVFASSSSVYGPGSGSPSSVDAVRVALQKDRDAVPGPAGDLGGGRTARGAAPSAQAHPSPSRRG